MSKYYQLDVRTTEFPNHITIGVFGTKEEAEAAIQKIVAERYIITEKEEVE
jgi:hypothetical protein